jgi:hypothetical protein
MLSGGSLSSRILSALDGDFRRPHLHEIYADLCACLEHNRLFRA